MKHPIQLTMELIVQHATGLSVYETYYRETSRRIPCMWQLLPTCPLAHYSSSEGKWEWLMVTSVAKRKGKRSPLTLCASHVKTVPQTRPWNLLSFLISLFRVMLISCLAFAFRISVSFFILCLRFISYFCISRLSCVCVYYFVSVSYF